MRPERQLPSPKSHQPNRHDLIESGRKTAEQIIATVSTKASMSDDQTAMLRATVSNVIDMETA